MTKKATHDLLTPLREAKSRIGGAVKLAQIVGITSQAVGQWRRCPAEYVVVVEKASGIPRHVLRPDVFPNDSEAAA